MKNANSIWLLAGLTACLLTTPAGATELPPFPMDGEQQIALAVENAQLSGAVFETGSQTEAGGAAEAETETEARVEAYQPWTEAPMFGSGSQEPTEPPLEAESDQEEGDFYLDQDYIRAYGEQCTDMIFYGDSRVVGMALDLGDYHYIGKVSMGYSWMMGAGMGLLESMTSSYPAADVVFCFGVNDLDNIGAYIGGFSSYLASHPNTRAWFMSVNPVDEFVESKNGYSVRNSQIQSFNSQMQAAFPDRYLDVYNYLATVGIETADGVHYGAGTYKLIEECAWRMIQGQLDNSEK